MNDENLGPQQAAMAAATSQACLNKLIFTIWYTRPFTPAQVRQGCLENNAKGVILEGEIPSEWLNPATGQVEPKPDAVNWPEMIFHLADLPIPKAVVSNFAPFVHHDGSPWPEKAQPLIQAGWHYISECFVSESPNSTPARTDWYAKANLGWPETQPMIEAWHIEDYGDLSMFRNVSHWDAGNVL